MKKKILWIAIVIILVGIAGFKLKAGGQAMAVEVEKAARGDIVEYIEETGNIMLEEETDVFSTASGRVTQVSKKAGETVKAGEILARIDNNDLLLQIKTLKAQKLSAEAKYDEIKSTANEEELRKLNAMLRSSEAAYEDAKRNMDNNRTLYEAGAVSLDAYKASITKLASAEAALESAKSSLASAQNGASANVRRQYEAQISEINTRIQQLEKKSEETVVIAPISGIVMESNIEVGSVVQAGTKIYEIGGSKGYFVECFILVEDIAGIAIGSPADIENDDLGIERLKGAVRSIHPKAVSKMSDLGIEQKRVRLEIDLEDTSTELRPGYDMTVRIITKSSKNALLIPEKAMFEYQGKPHVFVNDNGTARLKALETGIESDEMIEVTGGLLEGEEVILSPEETLKEGAKIKNKEA